MAVTAGVGFYDRVAACSPAERSRWQLRALTVALADQTLSAASELMVDQ